jgi:two-component system, chemotaxis family, response regulator Rcp1
MPFDLMLGEPADRLELLLVENNPGDVRLFVEALQNSPRPPHLTVARDGDEALRLLHRTAGASLPALIVLDLQLPGTHGREVLTAIKSDETLRVIPVVVLAGSRDREDIADSYERHANAYVSKPTDLDAFLAMARSIVRFWLHTATTPTRVRHRV